MNIKFLGTAAAEGWPALFCQCDACKRAQELGGKNIRTRASCLIDNRYLVDFSPDTYMHKLIYNLDLSQVESCFITHSHSDHFHPLDFEMRLDGFAHIKDRIPLNLYGNSKVKKLFDYALSGMDFTDVVNYHLLQPFDEVEAGDVKLVALPADHDKREDCFIYIIEINGKTLLYGHDSGYYPEKTWDELEKYTFDGVILDCTFGPKDCRSGHMGLSTDIDVKNRFLEIGSAHNNTKFIITHFSHNMKLMHHEIEKIAKSHGFITAYDGLEVEI